MTLQTSHEADAFVGRDASLQSALALLNDAPNRYVVDVEGIDGVGKSSFLRILRKRLGEAPSHRSALLELSSFSPLEPGSAIERGSTAALIRNLEQFRRLLVQAAEKIGDPSFAEFGAAAESEQLATMKDLLSRQADRIHVTVDTGSIHVGMFSRLAEGVNLSTAVVVKIPDDEIRLAIDHLKTRFSDRFAECQSRPAGQARLVLLFDDFDAVFDHELSTWLLAELAPRLDNTVIVVARSESLRDLPGSRDRVRKVPLGSLTATEVEECLRHRLGRPSIDPRLVARVVQFTGGHPRAVCLAADIALGHGLDRPDLLSVFDDVPSAHSERIRVLVEKLLADLDDEETRLAIEVGSVVRRFDGDMLRHLMTGEEDGGDPAANRARFDNIIRRLQEYSFTERVGDYHRFHEFIRRELTVRLMKESRSRLQELHRLAGVHFKGWLVRCEEQERGASPYECWYRYENADWLASMQDWLYHLSNSGNEQDARLEFARVYFDAFWWWGNYLEYEFCERLLVEWDQTRTDPDDREWLRMIRKFHEAYPAGLEKRGRGNWAHVEEALQGLRKRGRFAGPLARVRTGGAGMLHLRAITDLFLAESYRFRNSGDRRADTSYSEAHGIFLEAGDHWNAAWTTMHQADLAMERGQAGDAMQKCREAFTRAQEHNPEDNELAGNIYRVAGDAFWIEKEFLRAFDCYARAAYYAYAFQASPHPPDFYTVAFQREMTDHSSSRLCELVAAGQSQIAVDGSTKMREFWNPYWARAGAPAETPAFDKLLAAGRCESVTGMIFPPAPASDELGRGSDYTDRVTAVVIEMAQAAALEL